MINKVKYYVKQKRRITGLILLFIFLSVGVFAQTEIERERRTEPSGLAPDTLIMSGVEVADSTAVVRSIPADGELEHSPRKAMIYSLVLPGLGQGYNKKYWKIPIVYGVMGGVVYWIDYNIKGYNDILLRYQEDPALANAERYIRAWRRNLELSIITLVATHALQVVDAYVDANLYYWDVNPDLTVRVEPQIEPIHTPVGNPLASYGFKLSLNF